jgi:hypothetical protein
MNNIWIERWKFWHPCRDAGNPGAWIRGCRYAQSPAKGWDPSGITESQGWDPTRITEFADRCELRKESLMQNSRT